MSGCEHPLPPDRPEESARQTASEPAFSLDTRGVSRTGPATRQVAVVVRRGVLRTVRGRARRRGDAMKGAVVPSPRRPGTPPCGRLLPGPREHRASVRRGVGAARMPRRDHRRRRPDSDPPTDEHGRGADRHRARRARPHRREPRPDPRDAVSRRGRAADARRGRRGRRRLAPPRRQRLLRLRSRRPERDRVRTCGWGARPHRTRRVFPRPAGASSTGTRTRRARPTRVSSGSAAGSSGSSTSTGRRSPDRPLQRCVDRSRHTTYPVTCTVARGRQRRGR